MLNVSELGSKCHVGMESVVFKVKSILIVPLSSCFVATYDNIIVLRNEGKGA